MDWTVRKRRISSTPQSSSEQAWLDLGRHALVEVTSEEDGYPIESALLAEDDRGWRAATSGTQIIRLIFDEPHKVERIWLAFDDVKETRTQEFILRWSPSRNDCFREIVRQQWNFSPRGSVREIEDYAVELSEVAVLELIIVPDKSGGEARACLRRFRLA
jgi:hypothetical protein